MKFISRFISLCALFLVVATAGCIGTFEQEKDYGYPKVVRFSAEGGTEILKGKEAFSDIFLGERAHGIIDNDSVNAQWQWLTAKSALKEPQLTLTASPNDNPKTRQMRVEVRNGYEYSSIKVVQYGKIE